MTTIRGVLEVYIGAAEGLPDTDSSWFTSSKDTTDSYVKVKLDGAKLLKTNVVNNSVTPNWDQTYFIPINHIGDVLTVEVVDDDIIGSDPIGKAQLDFKGILENGGNYMEDKLQLIHIDADDDEHERGTIGVRITFTEYSTEEEYGPKIPSCYYPMREGCKVVLYQDAESPEEEYHNDVTNSCGETYTAASAWRDVNTAITEAEKFIYITGWSVYTEITLVREEGQPTLGELLKSKAEEGVKVLLLVWNEKLSTDFMEGMMGTHDEDTQNYFEDTDVQVVLAARQTNKGAFENEFVSTCYTHHQKSIICDRPAIDDDRKNIIAFVGGLDLTNGRYDTPRHPLFSTLLTEHSADFYQNCTQEVRQECGPRQPWHDIHARVEGQVSHDILANFRDRWRKQAAELEHELYPICEDEFITEEEPYEGDDAWSVQFLRSITHDSCSFISGRRSKLKLDRGNFVDDTIHRGYIHQIRRTKGFIYIENQYFLGSAHVWDAKDVDTQVPLKATNLIPIEIVRNITDAISLGNYHSVYVVIPMYPEGDPSSAAVQEILYWQTQTMEMMYRRIAVAIEEAGLDTHPTDYLSFYCLGRRGDDIPEELTEPENDNEIHFREKKRFMIYVHSKMMICDDEYIIVGSANINQRSMGGRRDTEMAVGCHQPNFMFTDGEPPQGDVSAFRKSLWGEHLGSVPEECNNPHTIECMRKVNEMAQENWLAYISDEDEVPAGHLLSYPILVSQQGEVTNLENEEFHNFPDTTASVLGVLSGVFPEKLTT